MVSLKSIADKFEYILNTNTFGKTFRVFSDKGELVKRNGHENEYRNGLVEIMSSNITSLSGLDFGTYNVNLTIYANATIRNKDNDGNFIEILELREILNQFIENYNGKTFGEDVEDKIYAVTYVISSPETLPSTSLGYIDECLPMQVNIGLIMFENGVNSNEWEVYLDGEELGYTGLVVSRVKTVETVPFNSASSTQTVVQTNGIGFDLICPQTTKDIINKIEEEILKCDNDSKAHLVYIKGHNTENAYICVFGNTQATLERNANVGFNISLLEGNPDLLTFEDNLWITRTVEVENLSNNTVTIENIDEQELFIKYDDGDIVKTSNSEIYHTFATVGEHDIIMFNANATDDDWANIEIKPYIGLDKMTYTVLGNNITVSKVNVPATTYIINDTYYVDGEINTVAVIGDGLQYVTGGFDKDAINITLPNTITAISDYAFREHSALKSIVLHEGLLTIGAEAFSGSGLDNIVIPSTVTSIGAAAFTFSPSANIDYITLLGSIPPIIGTNTFGTSYHIYVPQADLDAYKIAWSGYADRIFPMTDQSMFTWSTSGTEATVTGLSTSGTALTDITIPNVYLYNGVCYNTSKIGAVAFQNNTTLENVRLMDNMYRIESGAFNHCTALETITGGNITYVGQAAFLDSSLLHAVPVSKVTWIGIDAYSGLPITYLILSTSITHIGAGAFKDCSSLMGIECPATVPPTLESNAFDNTDNCEIYVPSASLSAYQSASGWSTYSSRLVGE